MRKILVCISLGFILGFGINLHNQYEAKTEDLTISDIENYICDYNDILIKEDLKIKYQGNLENIPNDLKDKPIEIIAGCEDTENTFTIILK